MAQMAISQFEEDTMEFLVKFQITVPEGTAKTEVKQRERAEAAAAAALVGRGHLLRVWNLAGPNGQGSVLGLYRADSRAQLDGLIEALPLHEWMQVQITGLEPHPNDPDMGGHARERRDPGLGNRLPEPRLMRVYRLDATLGEPLDLGLVSQGRRRIVPLTGGTFRGPDLNGELIGGTSADWQIVLPDGTALGDIRYTLKTDSGALLYVRSQSVRHGSEEVLARLARGDDVDASEYTFRTSTQIETAAAELDWLNKGIFIAVGGRSAGGVTYETYLVA
jgi:muconolactone delta-isomerase